MKEIILASPQGKTTLRFMLEEGKLYYEVWVDDRCAAEKAPIGIRTRDTDFSCGLLLEGESRGSIDESYSIPAFRKSVCQDRCNTLELCLKKGEKQLLVRGRAYDDGAAFCLVLPGEGEAAVESEECGFGVPENARNVYGQRLIVSYEDHYQPIPMEDLYQNRYGFPMLCELGGGAWALYAEAAAIGSYGGSNLLSDREHPRMLMVKKSPDQLGEIRVQLPFATPWRVVLTGSLKDIVEGNVLENLNPPSIVEDPSFIRPGRCVWSWMTEGASPSDPVRQREYVDCAAALGFEYSLDDAGWPGNVDIPELVKYAAEKGVGIWIWEHRARLKDPVVAEETLKKWAEWGVAGLKIDFFESDAGERTAQFEMLARLAAKYHLMLNFHGCMRPSGASRCWPHVLTYEGVMGGEYLQHFSSFLPGGPDAAHHCTLPFTRTVMGPMDFTPVLSNSYLTGTTDAHQTALTVIFTSYVLHIGERVEYVLENPCRPFLEKVKTVWDESLLLEGAPASYVTMARRSGREWFLGSICARRPRTVRLSMDMLEEGTVYQAQLYADDLSDLLPYDAAEGALGEITPQMVDEMMNHKEIRPCLHKHNMHLVRVETFTVRKNDPLEVPLHANGGFALYLTPEE